ncbi:aspartyl/asparaginyl beta-hydroxylase domain-containing protein [Mastigocladopsis repens]|uniref:aspartyl/asparaginyl beta-hydroxylase domain-containing protein n=1 Tax=Mastigocladopsis repens TaxID=221287 RepID=UPI0002D61F56|nr:aspartyl/asparaginyl beta-hydroxylase domain-containing protein [Mastigocladopsis repens]
MKLSQKYIDNGEYYKLRDRYHLVLQSQSGSWMKCGNKETLMHEGELWWFDNKQPHEAFNPSEEWRTHIIFDVLPPG